MRSKLLDQDLARVGRLLDDLDDAISANDGPLALQLSRALANAAGKLKKGVRYAAATTENVAVDG